MDLAALKEQLLQKGYNVSIFHSLDATTDYLDGKIHGKTVGFGDSATLLSMGLAQKLATHNQVYDPQQVDAKDFLTVAKQAMDTDVFLTSVNAMAETGELVNIDGTGNRVAGSLFGHKIVYFVVDTTKLEPTLDLAIWRARNIAAPMNAKRLHLKTPCAIKGDRCYNCNSPDRICNGMVIHLHKMDDTEMEIVLIHQK